MAETSPVRARRRAMPHLDRFDGLVLAVTAFLLAAMAAVIARGDRVGVFVVAGGYGPRETAAGVNPVWIRFSDAMEPASVEDHFRIEPAAAGEFAWSNPQTLTFTPARPWAAGGTYTVTVTAGARSTRRDARLHDDFGWTFSVPLPDVVYLGPADSFARNLYRVDLASGETQALTAAPKGIEDYAVSPDGQQIAYAQNNDDGTSDIWLTDLAAGTARPVTRCVAALCFEPAWQPGGSLLAYRRQDFNTGIGAGTAASRTWIVDLQTLETQLLFADPHILGTGPTWSPDGRRIAVYDASVPGIRVHDYTMRTDVLIESAGGTVGNFSPDGTRLVYPVLQRGLIGEQFYTHLEMADFSTVTRTRLSGPADTPVEDGLAVWSPDGDRLVIARRYLDNRFTPGKQLYLLDAASGEVTPLVVDAAYNHAAMRWDASGQLIVFQRFSLVEPQATPEIWLIDLNSGELRLIGTNVFLPQWVP